MLGDPERWHQHQNGLSMSYLIQYYHIPYNKSCLSCRISQWEDGGIPIFLKEDEELDLDDELLWLWIYYPISYWTITRTFCHLLLESLNCNTHQHEYHDKSNLLRHELIMLLQVNVQWHWVKNQLLEIFFIEGFCIICH